MLLAAGRGERMRPLSDTCPKPLLTVAGKALIVWQIEALVRAGFRRLVINHAWLGDQLEQALGQGQAFGAEIRWSAEAQALGTAGGVVQALDLLQGPLFAVVSADIHTGFDYRALVPAAAELGASQDLAHLVLVDDRRMHQDFDLHDGRVVASAAPRLTYGNIGLYRRSLFDGLTPGAPADLGRLLHAAIAAGRISGQQYSGDWDNIGSPDDLARVNDRAKSRSNPHQPAPETS